MTIMRVLLKGTSYVFHGARGSIDRVDSKNALLKTWRNKKTDANS